jgi:Transposase DDE domain
LNPNPISVAHQIASLFSDTADVMARQTGFVQRESKLGGSEMAKTLVFGWLQNPKATLEELAQGAFSLGVTISPQGLDQRFSPRAAAFFERLLHEAVLRVVSADPVAVPLLQRFAGGVCLLDSTLLTLPAAFSSTWRGCGIERGGTGAGIKAQVRLNLVDGTLAGPFLRPGCASDYVPVSQMPPLPPGALRLADLGFFSVDNLQQWQEQGLLWVSRLQTNTRFRHTTDDRIWTSAAFLSQQTTDIVDVPIRLGLKQCLPCRFVALRAPPEIVAKRHERMRAHIRRRKRIHPDRWALAEWTFFVTNIPGQQASVAEVWVLARCRWQIELLFKLWKSEGHIDVSRSRKPWRVLSEIYAKLLGMVVQHWLLLVGCWSYPNRSLVKASRTVRRQIWPLALVLHQRHLVGAILVSLRRCLTKGCRVNRRRRDPPTHQLLLGLSPAG